MMLATVDAIAPIRAKTRGRPRHRPPTLQADQGDDDRHLRLARRTRRSIPHLARGGVAPQNRRGRTRWVVERTLAWLNRFRCLKIRDEHRADLHRACLPLGCPPSPGGSAANHVHLARTVGLDRRARPRLY